MAFIDWLKKQHADSLRASQRLAADPFLKGVQPGVNTAPAPRGAIPFQRTKPGFFARDYKKEDLVDNTLTMKNDGSETLVRKWKDPDQSAFRVSALGDVAGSPLTLGPVRRLDRAPIAGQSYPGGSYGKSLRGVLPRRDLSPEAQAAIAQVQATGGQNVDASGNPIGVASIANIGMPRSAADSIGMPRVEDLRNRIAAIDRQQAAIPRQQMPPPRFVPPVDWRNFPQVQDRNTGTYNLGEPGVQMGGGFDWSGQALRENVGEDLRGVWNPIRERMQKIIEDIRRKREGQTMAPFDWRNN
jgi:hypothetical protein